jgi:hypothetical protein
VRTDFSDAVARGSSVLAKSVTEARIKANLQIIDLDEEDRKTINDYAASVEKEGKVQRFVYPPFGIDFGFPDKRSGKTMPNGL